MKIILFIHHSLLNDSDLVGVPWSFKSNIISRQFLCGMVPESGFDKVKFHLKRKTIRVKKEANKTEMVRNHGLFIKPSRAFCLHLFHFCLNERSCKAAWTWEGTRSTESFRNSASAQKSTKPAHL